MSPDSERSLRTVERRLLVGVALVGSLGLVGVQLALYRNESWTPVLIGGGALLSFFIVHAILVGGRGRGARRAPGAPGGVAAQAGRLKETR